MERKKYRYITCSKDNNHKNLLFAEYSPGLAVDLEVAKEIVANRLDFTNGEDHYVVIDLNNIKSVTSEAKEFMQSPEGGLQKILGAAFFANNPVASLIANVYVKTPTNFETRLFSTKQEATAWIQSYMNRHLSATNR
jgi:hypothetical protein